MSDGALVVGRVAVRPTGDGCSISIAPRLTVGLVVGLVFVPLLWASLLIFAYALFIASPPDDSAFRAVGVIGLACGALVASLFSHGVAMGLIGREEIVLEQRELILQLRLPWLCLRRVYALTDVHGVRVVERMQWRKGHAYTMRVLSFSIAGRVVDTERGLTEEEGKMLLGGPLRCLLGTQGEPPPK